MNKLTFWTTFLFLFSTSVSAQLVEKERHALQVISVYIELNKPNSFILNEDNACLSKDVICDVSQKHVLRLDLSNIGLKLLPTEIKDFEFLLYLDLSGNDLKNLPDDIGNLSELQNLELGANRFINVPDALLKLTNLETLSLIGNELLSIPAEIASLTNLQSLQLSQNNLSSLPAELSLLSGSIAGLDLTGNKFSEFNPGMKGFKHLNLNENNFSELSGLENLVELVNLSLDDNQITAIPDEIAALNQLQYLSIQRNRINHITPEIGQLKSLRGVYLTTNKILAIPPEIGVLADLQELNLSGNQITTLPPEIGLLGQLITLDLVNNKLTALPSELTELSRLEVFTASGNLIIELPESIGQMQSLKHFNFSNNHLTAIPASIGQLQSLSSFSFANNYITDLPEEISNLKQFNVNRKTCIEENFNLSQQKDCGPFSSSLETLISFGGNCLPNDLLSPTNETPSNNPKASEWLNKAAQYSFLSSSIQKGVCADFRQKPGYLVMQQDLDGSYIDIVYEAPFIQPDQFEQDWRYSIFAPVCKFCLFKLENTEDAMIVSGMLQKIDGGTWRFPIDTLDLGDYFVLISTQDQNSLTGTTAWVLRFDKLRHQDDLESGTLLNNYWPVLNEKGNSELNSTVNIQHPKFSGEIKPLSQITAVPGLESIEYVNGVLQFHNAVVNYHAAPVSMQKAFSNDPKYFLIADNLVHIQTRQQRLIVGAPKLAASNKFISSLAEIGLHLEEEAREGGLRIRPKASKQTFIYSAIADFQSVPAEISNVPGIFFEEINGLTGVMRGVHVFNDLQGNLKQQSIPAYPFDLESLKRAFIQAGYEDISLARDGLISAKKGDQQLFAYADYQVSLTINPDHYTEIFEPNVDYNDDDVNDLIFYFKGSQTIKGIEFPPGINPLSIYFKQKIYVFPSN